MKGAVNFCVDAGGTRCRGRLIGAAGQVLAEAEGAACNPATDLRQAASSLARLWTSCATATGRDPADIAGVTLALGGAGLAAHSVRSRFLEACPRFGRTVVMSDGYAALIGAGGGAPCALIIAGTGVAGHRLYADGTSIERDGWGWVGGDRGSGAWIGQRALRHALAVQDGVVPRDNLADRVMQVLRAASKDLRGGMVGMGPDRLAAMAPLVLAAAEGGDAAAVRILDRAAEHLAALARTLDLGEADPLFLAGGLAVRMRPMLAQRLGRRIGVPAADACTGCYLVATGAAPSETIIAARTA